MTRLRWRGVALPGALTGVLVAFAFGGTGGALAATPTLWSSAGQFALPAGAAATPTATSLPGVSCTGVGVCEAVGAYSAPAGTAAMAVPETGGQWGQTTAIASPSGATAAQLLSLSCAAAGVCTAVGNDTNGGVQKPITAAQTGGTWSAASELALPTGATSGTLNGVSCNGAGNCGAAGSDIDGGQAQPMVMTATGGVWGTPANLTLPTGATSGQLDTVSCTTPGNCVAAGSYVDSTGQAQAMVATETGGVWGAVVELPLPSAAASTGQKAVLRSISCNGAAGCSAVGSYLASSGQTQAMVDGVSAGKPAQAVELTLPTGAATAGQVAALDSVSCTDQGDCTATGSYLGGANAAPMAVSQNGGGWGGATALGVPADAVASTSPSLTALAVACPAIERCSAVGNYPVSGGAGAMALTSHPSLVISTAKLPAGAVGKRYSGQLVAAGGTGGNTWSLISGALPAGLTLDPTSGVVSGTPTTDQTATFGLAVTDNASPVDRATGTVTITIGPTTGTTTKPKKPGSGGKKKKTTTKKVFRGPKVEKVKIVHHDQVRFDLKCVKVKRCVGRVSLVAYEHLRGRHVIAINNISHRAKKTRVREITLGTLRYSVRGGHTAKHTIKLEKSALALLARRKRLDAVLNRRASTAKHASVVKKKLVVNQPPKKKKHKKHTKAAAGKKHKQASDGKKHKKHKKGHTGHKG